MEVLIHRPNIWFTADYHIGHRFMVHGAPAFTRDDGTVMPPKAPPRPMFSSMEEMRETIIERHNAVVKPGDLVYNLGDMLLMLTKEQAREFVRALNGNQYFIKGNHDSVAESIEDEFVWIKDLVQLKPKMEGVPPITLCHFAMRVWYGSHAGHWHLHGHSHGMLPEEWTCPACHHVEPSHSLSFDVGVDCWNFSPVSIEQVVEKMKAKMPTWEAYKASLVGSGRAE